MDRSPNIELDKDFCLLKKSRFWRWGDLNPRLPRCERGALPTELHPLFLNNNLSASLKQGAS